MRKLTLLLLFLMLASIASGFEITNYERSPSGAEIEYKELPIVEFKYEVPASVQGCRQSYGKNAEKQIICTKNEGCKPELGFFATKAEAGLNQISIECWDSAERSVINDNFTLVEYKEKVNYPVVGIISGLLIALFLIVIWFVTK